MSPLLRALALVVLLGFIGAESLCFACCHLAGRAQDTLPAGCHRTKAGGCHGCPTSAPTPASSSSPCSLLQDLIAVDASVSLIPDFHPVSISPPALSDCKMTESHLPATILADYRPRDWIFTPEVSLGPAFRSHAPPCCS